MSNTNKFEFITQSPLTIALFEKEDSSKQEFIFRAGSIPYNQLFGNSQNKTKENQEVTNPDVINLLNQFIEKKNSNQTYYSELIKCTFDVNIWTADAQFYYLSFTKKDHTQDLSFIPSSDSKSLFFEHNDTAILIVDKDGFPINSNQIYKTKFKKIHPSNKSIFEDKVLLSLGYEKQLRRAKEGQTVEFPVIKQEIDAHEEVSKSTFVYFKLTIHPIFELQKTPQKFVITIDDFTDQKRVSETLNESQNWLHSITDNAFDLISIVSFRGDFVYCNQRYMSVLGYHPNELIGEKSADYIYFEDRQKVIDSFIKIRETHKIDQITARYVTKDGHNRWMEHKGSIIYDINNNPVNVLIISTDISDKKQKEIELLASKQSYFNIYNTVTEAIFIQDINGTFLDVNKGAERMYGYSRTEFLGKNPASVMADGLNDIDKINAKLNHVFKTGKPETIEFWGKRKNGDVFPKNIIINKGKYFGEDVIISTARDISEHKKTELELINQRLRLENILEGTESGTWEWNLISNEITVNQQWATMLGYNLTEFSSMNSNKWKKLIHPDNLVLFTQTIKNHLNGIIDKFELECRMLHKNGSWIWIFVRGKIMEKDAFDTPIKMYGIQIDITNSKNAEEALIQSESMLKTLIDNAPFEIWARDKNNIGILENKKLVSHFGSIIGKTPFNFNFESSADKTRWIENNNRVFNGEIVDEVCDYVINNQRRNFHQIIAPIYKKGIIDGIAGFNIDITERKRAEDRINKLSACLLSFNSDAFENINKLVALCGEMLQGTVALYNQVKKNSVHTIAKWNTTNDFFNIEFADGNICNDLILGNSTQVKVVEDLKNSRYFKTDPTVEKYNLQTYIGVPIFYKNKVIGSLCILYNQDYKPNSKDLEFLKLVGFALTIEEERKRNLKELKQAFNRNDAILGAMPDMMFVFDKEGTILDYKANKNAEFLISPTQFFGKKITEIMPLSLANETMDRIAKVLTGEVIEEQSYTLPKDGKPNYFEARYISMENDQVMAIIRNVTTQKETAQKLIKSEEKYRTLVENAHDVIFTLSPEGIITYISPNIKLILGYSSEELTGKSFVEIIHPDDLEKSLNLLSDIANKKTEKGTIEYRIIDQKGEWQWHIVNASTILDSEGNIVDLMGIARDITEQKKREQIAKIQHEIALSITTIDDIGEFIKNTQNLLGTIIDTTNFYVAFYDAKTDTFSAPYMQDNFGILEQWQASTSLTGRVIIENKSQRFTDSDIKLLATQGKIELLGELAKCWIGVPLKNNEGINGVIVIQSYTSTNAFSKEDIEILEFISNNLSIALKRKKDENQIKLFGKAIEQSPLTIVITDINGIIEYVNPKFTLITGYSTAEVIGKSPRMLKGLHNNPETYVNLWKTITAGQQWFGELENKKKNDELFWESVGISPIHNKNGDITHYIGIKEDITEKKKMIFELIDAKNQAEESEKLKSAFLANMSHEIRTPLNGILGFASLLAESDIELSDIKEYAQIISQSGNRLLDLINNIIDVSKIESGSVKVSIDTINPYKLISDITTSFSIISAGKGLSIKLNIPSEYEHRFIDTDASKITQIISNLINNALKFTHKGEIEVGFIMHEKTISYFVKDTGVGISESQIVHIFDRFYQVDNSFSRDYEGAGLGLSICKGIAELLNGDITIDSEVGKGSTFWVNIPLAHLLEVNKKQPLTISQTEQLEDSKKILLVEDEENSALFVDIILKKSGFHVIRAKNGLEAIELYKSNFNLSLILMDIKMPVMDGFEATQQIRLLDTTIPIIALTAYAQESDREKIKASGCTDFLSKPLLKADLLSKIAKYIKPQDSI